MDSVIGQRQHRADGWSVDPLTRCDSLANRFASTQHWITLGWYFSEPETSWVSFLGLGVMWCHRGAHFFSPKEGVWQDCSFCQQALSNAAWHHCMLRRYRHQKNLKVVPPKLSIPKIAIFERRYCTLKNPSFWGCTLNFGGVDEFPSKHGWCEFLPFLDLKPESSVSTSFEQGQL